MNFKIHEILIDVGFLGMWKKPVQHTSTKEAEFLTLTMAIC